MSTTTPNLGLFKYDPTTDGKEVFSIQTALNDNWDILDTKAGSPETVVEGTTWYRRFSDGWKEQGGEVSLGETEFDWEQPTISSNGTMGGTTFACTAKAQNQPAYNMFDKNNSSAWGPSSGANYGDTWFSFYNPIPLKVTHINIYRGNYGYNVKSGTIYGCNDNSNWIELKSFADKSGANVGIDMSDNTSFYYYYKIYIATNQGANQVWIDEVTVTAKYKTAVANSITFPVAFSNTNYSYTFANQDGGGMDAYVSSKTTTGMTLSNTNSGSASWTACGY